MSMNLNEAEIQYLISCKERCEKDLVDDILPFWMEYGADCVNGGIYTCVDRDGTLMDSTKSVWFQGRWGFIAALAFLKTGQKDYLEASLSAIEFIENHCFDSDGHMFFAVTAEGEPVQKRRYVFSECFAIMAMAEYSLASGDKTYAGKAMALYKKLLWMMNEPGFMPPKYYFKARGHSLTMMLINVGKVISQVCDDPLIARQEDNSASELAKYFMNAEYKTILETVGMNGEFIDTGIGRTINPGHCMETGWFILDLARRKENDPDLTGMGLQIIDWAWNWGWDEPYGGIINFRDCKGFPCQDYSQDMKFWWPQCEAILASLNAYLASGDKKYLEMHRKVYDYAFQAFPDEEYGEWYGYLHRDGTVAQSAKGNLFKGPFHIPRMMILASGLYSRILEQG